MPEEPNKSKLLVVSDYFYPHWTGLSKSLYYFIQGLDTEIQMTVLTVRFQNHLPKRDIVFHTPVYREDPLFSFSRAKYSLSLLWRFIRLVPSHTTVFINSPNTNVMPLSILAKLFRKKLYIFHQGDLILPKGVKNRIIEKIFDFNSYIALSLADKVSTYTQDYAKHSRVLRPFLRKFSPIIFPLPRMFDHPSHKSSQKNITFGFAGRFVEEKGFDILFRAIPDIVKAIPNAKFLYAGEINMGYEDFFNKNRDLYEQVKDHVQLLGLLDEAELIKFYKSVDFLFVPSRSDCFNLVQAEAMLAGVPCISSDIPGLRFLVKRTGFGTLFRKEDPADLAKQTIALVNRRNTLVNHYEQVLQVLDRKKSISTIRSFLVD